MDTFALVADERRRLADELDELTDAEWALPSLCGAWTNHEVVAHLNVPFRVKASSFLFGMVKARGSFDLANERFAQDLARQLDPKACIDGLRTNADHRFTPPGFGPEAPLTDTIVHGGDVLRSLGRSVAVAPEALAVALPFVTTRKAGRGFGAISSEGIHLQPDDIDVSIGAADGAPAVTGPARSMACALVGRQPFLDDLSGPGVDLLRSRL